MSVSGDEAFLPSSDDTAWVSICLKSTRWSIAHQVAARIDRMSLKSGAENPDFNLTNLSLGLGYKTGAQSLIGGSLAQTERAPSANELFAKACMSGQDAMNAAMPISMLKKVWPLKPIFAVHSARPVSPLLSSAMIMTISSIWPYRKHVPHDDDDDDGDDHGDGDDRAGDEDDEDTIFIARVARKLTGLSWKSPAAVRLHLVAGCCVPIMPACVAV